MRTARNHLASTVLMVLSGCGDAVGEPDFHGARQSLGDGDQILEPTGEPLPSPVDIVFAPTDLMTSVRGDPSLVLLTEEPIAATELENLAARTELVSWPDERPVSITMTHEPADPAANSFSHRVTIHPTNELSEGWYALRLDASALTGFRMGAPISDGVALVRFRIGSQPIVRGVNFSPGDDAVGVTVELSERVRDLRPASEIVTLVHEGTVLDCVPQPGDSLQSEGGSSELKVACTVFPLDAEVRVQIAADVYGLAGRRVEVPFAASAHEIVINPVHDGALRPRDSVFEPPPGRSPRVDP